MYKIEVGNYHIVEMHTASGAKGKEKIHYEAAEPKSVKLEMDKFLAWLNDDTDIDWVLKAAIAHFWFIIIKHTSLNERQHLVLNKSLDGLTEN